MSRPSATESIRYAGLKARQLLQPFGVWKWLLTYLRVSGWGRKDDPVAVEIHRLQNYYRGTRMLARAGLLLVLLCFFLPFTVIFVGLDGFFVLLAAYVVLILLVSAISVVLEVLLDPVFALQYEEKISFGKAAGDFATVVRKKPLLVGEYMVIKLIIDMFLMTAILAMFMPMLLGAMALMLYILQAVPAGVDIRSTFSYGLVGILALTLLGLLTSALIIVFSSAFYGYFTEHAVRLMRNE